MKKSKKTFILDMVVNSIIGILCIMTRNWNGLIILGALFMSDYNIWILKKTTEIQKEHIDLLTDRGKGEGSELEKILSKLITKKEHDTKINITYRKED